MMLLSHGRLTRRHICSNGLCDEGVVMYNEETGMYEGYIYQIYNSFNMKSYIGQTTQTIKMRLAVHKTHSKKCNDSLYLYTDVRNFGWDIFDVYEVEKVECSILEDLRELLNEKEVYYISNYNTLYPNGYNISPGGNFCSIYAYKKVYQFNLNKELIAEYKSMADASYQTGVPISMISMCCNGHYATAGDFYWSNTLHLPNDVDKRRLKTRVVQYTLSGVLVDIFDSMMQAGLIFTTDKKRARSISLDISKCASGKSKTAHGYIWKRFEDAIDSDGNILERLLEQDIIYANTVNKNKFPCKPVSQYDKNGNYIRTFPSISEASIVTGINDACISACVTGRQMTAGGYIWKYASEE